MVSGRSTLSLMSSPPRVAFFPDSFHEVNGVAHTSRNFVSYAGRKQLPFLCVRAGNRPQPSEADGTVETLELPRGGSSIRIEKDLEFDPLFARHTRTVAEHLRRFRPDVIHITGPSDLGILGAYLSWKLGIPLAASWHTNVHEYAAHRMRLLTQHFPAWTGPSSAEHVVQTGALWATARFYRLAGLLFAPNPELCHMLARATGRPCHPMERGVDTDLFSPSKRSRTQPGNIEGSFILGYVGRLSVEKNVSLLPKIEHELALRDRGASRRIRFLIVGHGSEEGTLRSQLRRADFTGVLRGDPLAEAYANMDLLLFPSHTDTFGNVVLEALSSGVPAIVTPDGGPKYIVQDGQTGIVADDPDFARSIAALLSDPAKLASMRGAAREHALACSWDAVFDRVYALYTSLVTDSPRSRDVLTR